MNRATAEAAVAFAGLVFLGATAWSMSNLSYNIWGSMLLAPVYALLGLGLIRRLFRYESAVAVALTWGMLFKLGGAFVRYWVGFEAYDGGIDAARYHAYGRVKAGEIWAEDRSWFEVFPTGSGTEFTENFTALIYTFTGGSQLGGFVTFSFLAFVGIAFFVRAATIAVPDLAAKRYAWLCAVFPSLVYWPSSIGKEAVVLLGTGLAAYGIALLLAQLRWSRALLFAGAGLALAAAVRPHIAGIWIAAALPAIVTSLIRGRRTSEGSSNRIVLFFVFVLASAAFAALAAFTVRYLGAFADRSGTGTTSITDIVTETQRRTSEAGSNFSPPSLSNPLQWPFAIVRTLFRPLPIEARGLAQMLAAAEIVLLLGVYLRWWRNVVRVPRIALARPYVLFAVAALVFGGLAFATLANTGVLTRQKSLLFPLLLLLPCLPLPVRDTHTRSGRRGAHVSTEPGRSHRASTAQRPASYTADEIEELWSEPAQGDSPGPKQSVSP